MKIEEYQIDPIQAYLKSERYLNDGSPSGFSVNTTKKETSPLSCNKSFALKKIHFTNDIVIKKFGIDGNVHELIIHPDMITSKFLTKYCKLIEDDVLVSPTASGRTVYDYVNNRFVKLAYLDYLGRIIRHMEANKIISACETTKQLMKVTDSGKMNKRFSFLREDKGIIAYIPFEKHEICKEDKIPESCLRKGLYEWGVLFREFKPYPYIEEEEYLIPFFALFSDEHIPESNVINKDHELLIYQLFKKQDKSFKQFLLEDILYPLYNTYFDALILGGIELEAHAQNILLSVTKDFKVSRIVCRDLESAGRDIDLMEYFRLDYKTEIKDYKYNTRQPKLPNQKYDKYTTMHSFMFDFKLGEYIVTPLLKKINEKYGIINIEELSLELKAFNSQFIKLLPKDFFPKEWCSYASINYEKTGKERIYDWHENPKYRY